MEYRDRIEGIEAGQLRGFFVGWPDPPSPETLLRILEGSAHRQIAWDEEAGRVVGFVTALSDGVLSAFVPLLEVLPDWQGRGIGTELMRRLLAELDGLYSVDLTCDPELETFYSRLGMRRSSGMMVRDYGAQSGRPADAPKGEST